MIFFYTISNKKKMYNIYSEEKKLLESDRKHQIEKENILFEERHREKTNNLALNYQKRIKKFIIDVSNKKI